MDIKDEKEEPVKIDKNAMVLLVSDVHMGALRTNITLFDDFLTNIIRGIKVEYLKNLKALIILGDCFDIIMDNYEDFYEHKLYNDILNKFNILHKMDGDIVSIAKAEEILYLKFYFIVIPSFAPKFSIKSL